MHTTSHHYHFKCPRQMEKVSCLFFYFPSPLSLISVLQPCVHLLPSLHSMGLYVRRAQYINININPNHKNRTIYPKRLITTPAARAAKQITTICTLSEGWDRSSLPYHSNYKKCSWSTDLSSEVHSTNVSRLRLYRSRCTLLFTCCSSILV